MCTQHCSLLPQFPQLKEKAGCNDYLIGPIRHDSGGSFSESGDTPGTRWLRRTMKGILCHLPDRERGLNALAECRTTTPELQGPKDRSSLKPCGLPQGVTSLKNLKHQLLLMAGNSYKRRKSEVENPRPQQSHHPAPHNTTHPTSLSLLPHLLP